MTNGNDPEELLVFSHVPKTAGTSLLRVIESNYDAGEVAMLYGADGERRRDAIADGKEHLGDVKCVCCHQVSKILRHLPQPFRLFSIVRHPVEYNISLYHYLMLNAAPGEDGMQVVNQIQRKGWSLEDIYRNLEGKDPRTSSMGAFFNAQSQVICNDVGLGGRMVSSRPHPIVHMMHLGRFFPYRPISVETASSVIDEVLSIWSQRRYLLGITEKLDLSVSRFAKSFGWKNTVLPHENKSSRPRGEEISNELRQLIEQNNQVDLILWHRVASMYSSKSKLKV